MKNLLVLLVIAGITLLLFVAQEAEAATSTELEYAEKLIRDGMLDVARDDLERFLEGDVSPELRQHATILLGDVELARSKLLEARRLYTRAFEVSPRGKRACAALYKAGECCFALEQYRAAGATFERLVKLFPECPHFCPALTNIGRAFFERGDFEQAAREFERGLALCKTDERNAELLQWLAAAQARTSPERARATFELLRRKHPGSEAAFRACVELARMLRAEGNLEASLDAVDEALACKVKKELRGEALATRGELLVLIGRSRDAATAYGECFRLSPDSLLSQECNLRAQEAFLNAREYRSADVLAEKLLSKGPSLSVRRACLFTRARAARSRKALSDALQFLGRMGCAQEGDSLCCLASLEEGDIKERHGDFEGSVDSYLRALTLPGDDELHARALVSLGGLCATRTGEGERASTYFKLLVDLYPESESVEPALWKLARVYEQDGDYSRASQLYRKLAGDFPLGSRADEAQERAEILESLFPRKVGPEELRRLRILILSAANGSLEGDKLLEQAALLFETRLRSFEEAEAILGRSLMSSPPERKHLVLFKLGNVHLLLARKLAFEGKSKESAEHEAAGLRYMRDLVSQYGRTPLADDAQFVLMEKELERLRPRERHSVAATRYTGFLQNYPETDRFEEALLGRAQALMKLSREPGDDSYREALASYDKLIEEFPRSPLLAQAHYQRGHMLRKAGNVDAAERDFEIVLANYAGSPTVADAAYELGECKLARRELDRAISLYTSAFEKAGTRVLRERALARKGDCFLTKGQLDRAFREYEYILKHDPTGPFADDLLARQAEAFLKRGMVKEASGPVERLAARLPESPLLWKTLVMKAEAEARAGEFAQAAQTYRQIENRFPECHGDSSVMLGFARASFESGDFKSSLEAYERTLRLKTSAATRQEAGRGVVRSLAKMGEASRAQKRLGWYEKSFPADSTLSAEIALERGVALFEADELVRAYKTLSGAQGKLRAEAKKQALVTMGMCKLKQREFGEAAQHFGEAVKLAPADSALSFKAYFKLGTSLYAQGKHLQASRAYLSASRLSSDPSTRCDAWYNGALCLEKAEKWSDAASLYEKMAGGCKGKLARDAAFKTGYCEYNAGRHRKAVELLRHALNVVDEEEKAEVQYWIAEAHVATGDFERASSEFLKVPFLYGEGSMWAVTARFKAGLAFEETGNSDAAAKQYRILLESEGERSQWGSMARERLLNLSK